MSQFNPPRTLIGSTAAVVLALALDVADFVPAAEIEPAAADVIRKANATQLADLDRWSSMSGEGRVELIDPEGMRQWSRRMRFVVSGQDLLVVFDRTEGTRGGLPISNPLAVAADGKTITGGLRRSEADDEHSAFALVSEGCRIDPRWVILPPVLRSNDELEILEQRAQSVRLVNSGAGTFRVDVEYPNATVNRYWFAPDLDYRVVRLEVATLQENEMCWVYQYEWQLVDAEVNPNIVVLQCMNFPTRKGMFTHRLNLNSIRPVSRQRQ